MRYAKVTARGIDYSGTSSATGSRRWPIRDRCAAGVGITVGGGVVWSGERWLLPFAAIPRRARWRNAWW